MGYYTYFNIDCEIETDNKDRIKALSEAWEKMACYEPIINCNNGDEWQFNYSMELKWYECEEDLKEFVEEFPEIIFLYIHADGEDEEDIWELEWNGRFWKKREVVLQWSDWNRLE